MAEHDPVFREATRERCAVIECAKCGEQLAYGDFAQMYRDQAREA